MNTLDSIAQTYLGDLEGEQMRLAKQRENATLKENRDMLIALGVQGTEGLDRSPGDPIARWAYDRICTLERSRDELEADNAQLRAARDDALIAVDSWVAECKELKTERDQLRVRIAKLEAENKNRELGRMQYP